MPESQMPHEEMGYEELQRTSGANVTGSASVHSGEGGEGTGFPEASPSALHLFRLQSQCPLRPSLSFSSPNSLK
jgi:hypothetical protein